MLKNPQVVEFMDFAPSRMSVHFIPYRNINSGQSRQLETLMYTL
jgi:hypothetical protein